MMFEVVSTCRAGGYVYCRTDPPHPKRDANGLVLLHRVVVENELGRMLDRDEVVHHRDENKTNNDLSNLEVLGRAEHTSLHRRAEPVELVCPVCGAAFSLKPHVLRQRAERAKGPVVCSRTCRRGNGGGGRRGGHSYRGGCRCDECRAEHAAQQRRYRSKIKGR